MNILIKIWPNYNTPDLMKILDSPLNTEQQMSRTHKTLEIQAMHLVLSLASTLG
jgi:hypothetical protein